MRRQYTREEYIEICKKIRTQIPDVTITSDFIVGFPGETDEQFEETLSVIDEVELDYSNTAAYSPRKQTPAATWRDRYIDEQTKKERLFILNEKVKKASRFSNEKYLGRVLEVLADGSKQEDEKTIITGRTRNGKLVHFEGNKNLIGTLVNIKIEGAFLWCLKGKVEV